MTEYLIFFNDEWVPDHSVEELREKSKAVRALVAEMTAAGVLIFTGGLDDAAPVFSVDASSGTPEPRGCLSARAGLIAWSGRREPVPESTPGRLRHASCG
jgi:hypothetical protein